MWFLTLLKFNIRLRTSHNTVEEVYYELNTRACFGFYWLPTLSGHSHYIYSNIDWRTAWRKQQLWHFSIAGNQHSTSVGEADEIITHKSHTLFGDCWPVSNNNAFLLWYRTIIIILSALNDTFDDKLCVSLKLCEGLPQVVNTPNGFRQYFGSPKQQVPGTCLECNVSSFVLSLTDSFQSANSHEPLD